MPLTPVRLRPGIDVEQTPRLNSAGWSRSQLIRWREGMPEKLGGWQRLTNTPLIGTARGSEAWADLSGNPYLAVGTEQRLELFVYGNLYDITPRRHISNAAPSFSTQIGSPTVQIIDAAFGGTIGDWILITIPVSVGGLVLQGFYQIASVVDANTYTITAAANATGTVVNGGAVPLFTTTVAVADVQVTLNNHGLVAGSLFGVQVAVTVGGITIGVSSYAVEVAPPVTTNTFFISPAGVAASGASVSENGGNARIEYLIQTGFASVVAETGYGAGPYGGGPYGGAQGGTVFSTIRQWFLDHFGQDLIGNYSQGPLCIWTPPLAAVPGLPTVANPAEIINTTNFPGAIDPPQTVNASFVSMPAQIVVVLGAEPTAGQPQDPNLIRWSDVSDFTNWTATVTNQAGSFRLPSGSRIVGGIQGPQFGYIWTDIDFWLMSYIGTPFIFGFNKVAEGCELFAARAAAAYNGVVYWLSSENPFTFDGNTAQPMECPVWDIFFKNVNKTQRDKIWCWVNSAFNEIWWFYPSLNSNEVDSYIKYHTVYRCWDYGLLSRLCGQDTNVYGPPYAVDNAGLIQQHEIGYDADGSPMMPSIRSGFFSIADGQFFTVVERMILDFILTGGIAPNNRVFVNFLVQNYPTDPVYTLGPYAWTTSGPPYNIVRGRGRVAAIEIFSTDLGVFWRAGNLLLRQFPAGSR